MAVHYILHCAQCGKTRNSAMQNTYFSSNQFRVTFFSEKVALTEFLHFCNKYKMVAVKFRNFYNVLHVVGTGEQNHLSTLHFNSDVFTKYLRVSTRAQRKNEEFTLTKRNFVKSTIC